MIILEAQVIEPGDMFLLLHIGHPKFSDWINFNYLLPYFTKQ
jgi:hypothetical protein